MSTYYTAIQLYPLKVLSVPRRDTEPMFYNVTRVPRCACSCTPAGYEVALIQHQSEADMGKRAECSGDRGHDAVHANMPGSAAPPTARTSESLFEAHCADVCLYH